MNNERLIELVRKHSVIYDFEDPKYRDIKWKETIWREIGKKMKVQVSACKSRWHYLRGDYRKYLRKKSKDDDTKTESTYKYSEQMRFLENYFQKRTITQSNEKPYELEGTLKLEPITTETKNLEPVEKVSKSSESGIMPLSQDPKPSQKCNILHRNSGASKIITYIGNENSVAVQPTIHPVDAFLNALSPSLKSLTPYYLNLAKSEIFSVVQDYELTKIKQEGRSENDLEGTVSTVNSTFHSVRQIDSCLRNISLPLSQIYSDYYSSVEILDHSIFSEAQPKVE